MERERDPLATDEERRTKSGDQVEEEDNLIDWLDLTWGDNGPRNFMLKACRSVQQSNLGKMDKNRLLSVLEVAKRLTEELEELRKEKAERTSHAPSEPQSLAPGDIVRLKSGGPAMTVGQLMEEDGTRWVLCAWDAAQRGVLIQRFPVETVEKT